LNQNQDEMMNNNKQNIIYDPQPQEPKEYDSNYDNTLNSMQTSTQNIMYQEKVGLSSSVNLMNASQQIVESRPVVTK
jgi:hypothetical protein